MLYRTTTPQYIVYCICRSRSLSIINIKHNMHIIGVGYDGKNVKTDKKSGFCVRRMRAV